mmetsp:Transcript_23617/g.47672  ORF Transcript_23617/g.47672 Transcript_23617/m.47672 type:complete len:120 (+) Transcript_23617:210-569(+)
MIWTATIFGPENTPWKDAILRLILKFSEDYPNTPPEIKFCENKFFHPNVYKSGEICLDILQKRWSPIFTVGTILASIQSLLSDPNPDSPANSQAAIFYHKHVYNYNKKVSLNIEASWEI